MNDGENALNSNKIDPVNNTNDDIEKAEVELDDKPFYLLTGPSLPVSNVLILLGVLSGIAIPILNKYYEHTEYSIDEAELLLKVSAVLLGGAWSVMQMMRWCAYSDSDATQKSFQTEFNTVKRVNAIGSVSFYTIAFGVAILGAAGVAASCGWLLSTGEWNDFEWGSRLMDSQSDRTFTAMYGMLGGAAAAFGVVQLSAIPSMICAKQSS